MTEFLTDAAEIDVTLLCDTHGREQATHVEFRLEFVLQAFLRFVHQVGDEALRTMVGICKKHLRSNDIFGRLGGEEFAALLVGTTHNTGMEIAERLRGTLSETEVRTDGVSFRMTISIGLTAMAPKDKGLDEMVRRSDKALYLAKNSGRNQVAKIL